jgi:hypothetical protein
MDHTILSGFIESRADFLESLAGIVFLSGSQELEISSFQGVELRLNAAVVQSFASAAAHAAFG